MEAAPHMVALKTWALKDQMQQLDACTLGRSIAHMLRYSNNYMGSIQRKRCSLIAAPILLVVPSNNIQAANNIQATVQQTDQSI